MLLLNKLDLDPSKNLHQTVTMPLSVNRRILHNKHFGNEKQSQSRLMEKKSHGLKRYEISGAKEYLLQANLLRQASMPRPYSFWAIFFLLSFGRARPTLST
jgi:hypothetical protein